ALDGCDAARRGRVGALIERQRRLHGVGRVELRDRFGDDAVGLARLLNDDDRPRYPTGEQVRQARTEDDE
ncbi:MAG: hypothetical protein ACRDY6_06075, partial [Acidimicrobiia bacterium]